MALELVCGADFWCNRHCRTAPVVLEGFWGQVWPKIVRKPEKSEYRVANEPLSIFPSLPTWDPTCGANGRPAFVIVLVLSVLHGHVGYSGGHDHKMRI